MSWSIGPAGVVDMPAVLALLEQGGLPLAGLADHQATTLVARAGEAVVGSAALEVYGSDALLRSLAVEPAWRGHGLGQALTWEALTLAERLGIARVYLLTETAASFFSRFGFQPVQRAIVAPGVRQSIEFTAACPATALAMVKHLGAPARL